jgi:hypothetical protein
MEEVIAFDWIGAETLRLEAWHAAEGDILEPGQLLATVSYNDATMGEAEVDFAVSFKCRVIARFVVGGNTFQWNDRAAGVVRL